MEGIKIRKRTESAASQEAAQETPVAIPPAESLQEDAHTPNAAPREPEHPADTQADHAVEAAHGEPRVEHEPHVLAEHHPVRVYESAHHEAAAAGSVGGGGAGFLKVLGYTGVAAGALLVGGIAVIGGVVVALAYGIGAVAAKIVGGVANGIKQIAIKLKDKIKTKLGGGHGGDHGHDHGGHGHGGGHH